MVQFFIVIVLIVLIVRFFVIVLIVLIVRVFVIFYVLDELLKAIFRLVTRED